MSLLLVVLDNFYQCVLLLCSNSKKVFLFYPVLSYSLVFYFDITGFVNLEFVIITTILVYYIDYFM